jgi:aldehyde dehydrogenase (NAD+)
MPVMPYRELDTVLNEINARPKPLALYVFASDKQVIGKVMANTTAGGSCINSSVVHFLQENLPFGGVNDSGIGKGHGVYGFKAFSNARSVVEDRFSMGHIMYPPYTPRVRKLIKMALRYLS